MGLTPIVRDGREDAEEVGRGRGRSRAERKSVKSGKGGGTEGESDKPRMSIGRILWEIFSVIGLKSSKELRREALRRTAASKVRKASSAMGSIVG